jgi:hypothetical protein
MVNRLAAGAASVSAAAHPDGLVEFNHYDESDPTGARSVDTG